MLKKLISYPYFVKSVQKYLLPLWFFSVLLLLIGFVWGLCFAPKDYQQGDAFRLIYVHVPAAFFSLFIYACMAVSAVIFYIWRVQLCARFCHEAVVLGMAFTFLALVSGALWGKPMWGVFWSWHDARLVSELLLLFIYLGYWLLIHSLDDVRLSNELGSILLVIGSLNLPIIHFSVTWWTSLHQGSTLLKFNPSISLSMALPLFILLLGFLCFSLAFVLTRLSVLR